MELYKLTGAEAVKKIQKNEISTRELIDSCIARIENIEDSIRAWAYFDKNLVYTQLEEIETRLRSGNFDGYFYGVPFGIKDIFNTKDMPTEMGSPIWKGFTPGNDARAVDSIRLEGGIVMGKTVTAEFAVHYPGPTVNPYNAKYSPGTSSSGSAAAVATGMVPLAIGTQTAGSIIRPASYCGVYGYKPSFGLLARTGVLKTVDPLDHVGFLTRSIDDLKLMLDGLRVKGPNYPYVHKYLEDPERQTKKKDEPWRVAFVKTYIWDEIEQYTKDDITGFIKKLSRVNGVDVKEVELPAELKNAHRVHETIYSKALSYYFKEEYEQHPDQISGVFKKMVEDGKKIRVEDYVANLDKQNMLSLSLDNFFRDYDAIFAISTAGEAPKADAYMDEKRDTSLIWTLCRVPSMNIPMFKGPHGLPFGIQAVARRYNDYRLLSLLKYLEEKGMIKEAEVVYEGTARWARV